MKAILINTNSGLAAIPFLELIYFLLSGDEHFLRVIFEFNKRPVEYRKTKIKQSILVLRHSQQVIVRFAIDFWNQSILVEFVEFYKALDEDNCTRLISAIRHQNNFRKEVMQAPADDEDGNLDYL